VRRLLIGLLVLAVVLVVVDRVAASYANRRLAGQIRTELALREEPTVRVHGVPFLTQAIGGRYDDVRVRLPDVDSGSLHGIAVDARLQGVHAPLGDVLRGRIDRVPVDRITGDLTIRYDDLARASGISGLRIAPDGDALRVSGSVEVLGQQVSASAVGRVDVSGNDIVITAERAEVDGVPLPQAALDLAAKALSFAVSPRSLPLSLRITAVRAEQSGLRVSAESDDAVLSRTGAPVR
jgi:LmeA-like phospholipid-binding